MSFHDVQIGDLGRIVTGKTPPTNDSENYNGFIPFVTPADLNGNRSLFQTERYISDKGKETVKNCLLPKNSVCVSCIGSDMGKTAITTCPSVTNQQINSIIVHDHYNYLYVYYLMCTLEQTIKSLGKNGTAIPILNKSKFSSIRIRVPDYSTQSHIANILSAYDDLIENNQKQIKLLEEAAQRLYKEWFIDLHFPGYETTPVHDGVPEGWVRKTLGEIADIIMGQSPKSEYYNTENRGLPFHQGVGSYGNRFVIDDVYSTSYTRIADAGSILFSVRAPVGRLNITRNKIVIGRGIAALNQNEGLQSLLFYMLKERYFKDNLVGNGSIFASISKDELLEQSFIVPVSSIARQYDEIASTIDKKIDAVDKEIIKLTEARDRLLPKLMSGEIEV